MFPQLSTMSGGYTGGFNADSAGGGMEYENPMFKVRYMTLTDELTEHPKEAGEEKDNDYADKFSVGDNVSGTLTDSEKTTKGQIVSITKNSMGDGMILVVLDSDGKKVKIDASTASKIDNNTDAVPSMEYEDQ